MTEIKICGITNIEDGLAAASAGADALGFVFHPASPRYVTPGRAREIIGSLPQAVCTVGVFVNLAAEEDHAIAQQPRVDVEDPLAPLILFDHIRDRVGHRRDALPHCQSSLLCNERRA